MELNGTLWNPLEKGKTGLSRLPKLVRDLQGRATSRTQRTLPRRRKLVGAAAEAVVRTADGPVRIADVCAALKEQALEPKAATVRKALHDRSRGPDARLRRICRGVYAVS
jgi:hypothetical protein